MKAISCGLFLCASLPLLARQAATTSPDPNVMAVAHCVVNASALKPMPAAVGASKLPASIRGKLRMLGYAAPSNAKIEWARGESASHDGGKSLIGVRERRQNASAQEPFCPAMGPQRFIRGAGRGTMRNAIVAVASAPVEIWRVFSDTPSFCAHSTIEGAWWSLSDPRQLGKAAARHRNGICVSWNKMNRVMHCKLKPGAPLAIGPSESVSRQTCSCNADDRKKYGDGVDDAYVASDSYPADDSTLQVYINVRLAGGLAPLMTCDAPVAWPDAPARRAPTKATAARQRARAR